MSNGPDIHHTVEPKKIIERPVVGIVRALDDAFGPGGKEVGQMPGHIGVAKMRFAGIGGEISINVDDPVEVANT